MIRKSFLLFSCAWSLVGIVVACGGSDGSTSGPLDPDGGASSSSSGGSSSGGSSSGTTSGSSSGGATGIYTPAQPGQGTAFCDASFGKLSAKLMQCCSADDQKSNEWKLAAGVTALAVQQCGTLFERSISEGHVEIDTGAAQSCETAYTNAIGTTCTPGGTYGIDPNAANDPNIVAGLATCKVVFRGKVAENGACAQDVDCVDGLTCVGYSNGADGTCKQPPPIGQPCGEGASDGGTSITLNLNLGNHPKCATGAYCNKTCLAQSAPGGSCSKDEQCAGGKKCHAGTCGDVGDSDVNGSCKYNDDCKTGLYCQGVDAGQLGTCQPKLSDGAACNANVFSSECKGRCEKPEGGTAGTCKSMCGSG